MSYLPSSSMRLRFAPAPIARRPLALLALAGAAACAPRAAPLVGTPAPAGLPEARLSGSRRVVFRWALDDASLRARGEGVARISAPDSARLDFFLDGGMGGGTAFLIGDHVDAPGGDLVRRLLPPPALLWAALGRLAVPAAADTAARLLGDTLRADIGRDPTFRVTFVDGRLRGVARIEDGRRQEWVAVPDDSTVEYRHEGARRHLVLTITRADRVEGGFDASIWPH
ncbi:MAG TPA: hypothetical protein VFS08_10220 [Gemmatimonadaceae bacterium]|nr:hypothetical protein [Gemmatimonadaceae bacterium]